MIFGGRILEELRAVLDSAQQLAHCPGGVFRTVLVKGTAYAYDERVLVVPEAADDVEFFELHETNAPVAGGFATRAFNATTRRCDVTYHPPNWTEPPE